MYILFLTVYIERPTVIMLLIQSEPVSLFIRFISQQRARVEALCSFMRSCQFIDPSSVFFNHLVLSMFINRG